MRCCSGSSCSWRSPATTSAWTGAETEARIVAQQVETAQFLPEPAGDTLTSQLVCYARSVAGVQWARMEAGTLGEDLNPWSVKLLQTMRSVDPKTASEQAAYSKWLDERSDREDARSDRIHGAAGVIPLPLWIVLFFSAAIIFLYMLFFADSGERALVQAVLMGSVVAVIVATLLLLQYLDNPFHKGLGGLRPVAMQRTERVIDQEIASSGMHVDPPCDAQGNPRRPQLNRNAPRCARPRTARRRVQVREPDGSYTSLRGCDEFDAVLAAGAQHRLAGRLPEQRPVLAGEATQMPKPEIRSRTSHRIPSLRPRNQHASHLAQGGDAEASRR